MDEELRLNFFYIDVLGGASQKDVNQKGSKILLCFPSCSMQIVYRQDGVL